MNPEQTAWRSQDTTQLSPKSDKSGADVSVASIVAADGGEGSRVGIVPPFEAEKWFDDSNQNTKGKSNVQYTDDDPPFYLRGKKSSAYEGNKSGDRMGQATFSNGSNNSYSRAQGGFVTERMQSNGSSSEDYRSVIDDLTVENKSLKKRLERYEQMNLGSLQNDKLFEVRVHGLSPTKRRKLERLLRDFASTLNASGDNSGFGSMQGMLPNTKTHKPHRSSSSNSASKPTDSAYASMSTSGEVSVPPSASGKGQSGKQTKDDKVQRYLQNMSDKLLPKYPPVLTEIARKQLVVKRLEQLFTGRQSTSGKQSQSQQQQEVSQSAADAERREGELSGRQSQIEGKREAKIYTGSLVLPHDDTSRDQLADTRMEDVGKISPDQRPTRPLDLDPFRAQNPSENIDYIKHLGFESPKVGRNTYDGNQGFISLNLLFGMAQLHTLNVTPEFARRALSEISTQFELSPDGQTVRWVGGNQGTLLDSDSGVDGDTFMDSSSSDFDLNGSKSSKPSVNNASNSECAPQRAWQPSSGFRPVQTRRGEREKSAGTHTYSPLFFHGDEDDYSYKERSYLTSSRPTDDTSGQASSSSMTREGQRPSGRPHEDAAPVIYYNGGMFCTDLSGDAASQPSGIDYHKYSKIPIGCKGDELPSRKDEFDIEQRYFTFDAALQVADTGKLSLDSGSEISFAPQAMTSEKELSEWNKPADKQSSGVGGIVPADCFDTCVLAMHRPGAVQLLFSYQNPFAAPPLPSPSYAFVTISRSNTEESDEDSSSSDSDASGDENLQGGKDLVPAKYLGSFTSNSLNRSGNSSDSSSIDMLTHARQIEPENIAAQEREYDQAKTSSRPKSNNPGSAVATIGDKSSSMISQKSTSSSEDVSQRKNSAGGKGRQRKRPKLYRH